jgi:hypothetical protein
MRSALRIAAFLKIINNGASHGGGTRQRGGQVGEPPVVLDIDVCEYPASGAKLPSKSGSSLTRSAVLQRRTRPQGAALDAEEVRRGRIDDHDLDPLANPPRTACRSTLGTQPPLRPGANLISDPCCRGCS